MYNFKYHYYLWSLRRFHYVNKSNWPAYINLVDKMIKHIPPNISAYKVGLIVRDIKKANIPKEFKEGLVVHLKEKIRTHPVTRMINILDR